jgi:hypothetical protein
MAITEWGKMGELEKGEVPYIREEKIIVPRWIDARSRTYYYKVFLQECSIL